jgi:murein L,D-transpeptidase YcbB/YkuD
MNRADPGSSEPRFARKMEGIPPMISARKSTLAALIALSVFGGGADAQLRIQVNVPAYRMDVYRGEEKIRTYPVAVGSPRYPTPLGGYRIGTVEWNPWWNPPASPWARGEKRTPPGPSNPMGRAKLEFTPLYYLHGSTAKLGRAVSHGCIRMANADVLELARLVAEEVGAPITSGEISGLESSSRRTRRVTLPEGVPVQVLYRLTEEVDGEIKVYDDIYKMGVTESDRALRERASASVSSSAAAARPSAPGS